MEAGRPGGNTAGEMPGLFPFESGSGSTGIGRGCPSIPVRPPASGHRAGHRRFIPRELEGSHSFLMDKKRVSAILNEIGMLLELKGENPFKCRAYSNAARVVEGLAGDLGEEWRDF